MSLQDDLASRGKGLDSDLDEADHLRKMRLEVPATGIPAYSISYEVETCPAFGWRWTRTCFDRKLM